MKDWDNVVLGMALLVALGTGFIGVSTRGIVSFSFMGFLAVCCVYAAVAQSYDLMLGDLGRLSFGHALWFAGGGYGVIWALKAGMTLPISIALTLVIVAFAAGSLGVIALRVDGIAFAMVTLAFAQAFYLFIALDPMRIAGGEEGLALTGDMLPKSLVGLEGSGVRLLLAAGALLISSLIVVAMRRMKLGILWHGIKCNRHRVYYLGIRARLAEWIGLTVAAILAGMAGIVFVIISGGITPLVANAMFSFAILVMVILGGSGTNSGSVVGAWIYAFLLLEMPSLMGLSLGNWVPSFVKAFIGEPDFITGIAFLVIVFMAPRGIVGSIRGIENLRTKRANKNAVSV